MRCAAATANTRTNGTKMTMHQQNGRGLLASKDSRTRIKVVRKGAEKACVGIRCSASKNPSDGGKKGGKSGIAGEKVRGGKRALQNKAVSEPPSSQGRQSDLTPAFISPSQFTEMQLSTSQMKNLASQRPTDQTFVSQFAADEPRKGADILVEALEREGVDCVFAYPGGASTGRDKFSHRVSGRVVGFGTDGCDYRSSTESDDWYGRVPRDADRGDYEADYET